MPKPSDMLLGIIEFFAVLLPGALVTWMLWRWPWPIKETGGPFSSIATIAVPFLPSNSTARWVAFGVVSWGVGQVLFAAAPPMDWVWDWLRHNKRIKKGKFTDEADRAVVALRFALLGLSFPAVTDLQSGRFERALKALSVVAAIILIGGPAAYIVFPLGKGFLISISLVIVVVFIVAWCLLPRKKLWKADVAVAEKEAVREHGEWARQYLRQVNIASFTAPVALSIIKGAAKESEEAAGKLRQIADPRRRNKQRRPQQLVV